VVDHCDCSRGSAQPRDAVTGSRRPIARQSWGPIAQRSGAEDDRLIEAHDDAANDEHHDNDQLGHERLGNDCHLNDYDDHNDHADVTDRSEDRVASETRSETAGAVANGPGWKADGA